MARKVSTTEELLNTFDWNVSLFALDESGIKSYENIDNIKPGGELWLQKLTYPKSTLRRGFRFSERFKMKIRESDLEKICNGYINRKNHVQKEDWK